MSSVKRQHNCIKIESESEIFVVISPDTIKGSKPTRRTSWKLVGNPGWQPGFPTSFQLVSLVGCGLKHALINIRNKNYSGYRRNVCYGSRFRLTLERNYTHQEDNLSVYWATHNSYHSSSLSS